MSMQVEIYFLTERNGHWLQAVSSTDIFRISHRSRFSEGSRRRRDAALVYWRARFSGSRVVPRSFRPLL